MLQRWGMTDVAEKNALLVHKNLDLVRSRPRCLSDSLCLCLMLNKNNNKADAEVDGERGRQVHENDAGDAPRCPDNSGLALPHDDRYISRALLHTPAAAAKVPLLPISRTISSDDDKVKKKRKNLQDDVSGGSSPTPATSANVPFVPISCPSSRALPPTPAISTMAIVPWVPISSSFSGALPPTRAASTMGPFVPISCHISSNDVDYKVKKERKNLPDDDKVV